MKLTNSQKRYLRSAPFSYTSFGCKYVTIPFKGFRADTAYALVKGGFLRTSKPSAFVTDFTLTELGHMVTD